MRPPICRICGKRCEMDGLLEFLPTEDDLDVLDKMRNQGMVGHPPNLEWFCKKHFKVFRKLTNLTLGEAFIKADLKRYF